MRKKYLAICLSLLTVGFPTCIGISSSLSHNNEINQLPLEDTPDWATGYFAGFVGITSNTGNPGPYGGLIAGYYEKEDFKGKFAGVIAKKETSEVAGFIGGYLGGPFLLGIITNRTTEKVAPIVGIGVSNETHMYYRIMGIFGPTLYIAGKYQPL